MLGKQTGEQAFASSGYLVVVTAALALLTAVVLASTRFLPLDEGLRVALFIVAGMLIMAVMTALQGLVVVVSPSPDNEIWNYLAQSGLKDYKQFPLNAKEILPILEDEFAELKSQPIESEVGPTPSWGMTTDELLRRDPNLALARLRMDLENELRRVFFDLEPNRDTNYRGSTHLAEELAKRRVLPESVAQILRDVLRVSNQAVHGRELSFQQASTTVQIGDEILAILRRLPIKSMNKRGMTDRDG
jgi:hypothetical protein